MAEPDGPAGSGAGVEAEFARLDQLLSAVEILPEHAREAALDAVAGLSHLYGQALARVVAMVAAGGATVQDMADDDLVGHLLLLHGLHPDTVQERVARALEEARPHLGGAAELVGIADGVARIEVAASGCSSSASSTASSLRDLVVTAAPELADVEAVNVAAPPPLIPVDSLRRRRP